jgi:hypothetical protein
MGASLTEIFSFEPCRGDTPILLVVVVAVRLWCLLSLVFLDKQNINVSKSAERKTKIKYLSL